MSKKNKKSSTTTTTAAAAAPVSEVADGSSLKTLSKTQVEEKTPVVSNKPVVEATKATRPKKQQEKKTTTPTLKKDSVVDKKRKSDQIEKVPEKVEKSKKQKKEETTLDESKKEDSEEHLPVENKKKNKRKEAKTEIEVTLRKEDVTMSEDEFKKCFHDALKIYRGSKRCVIVHLRDTAQVDKYLSKEAEDGSLIPLNKNFVEVCGKIFEVKRSKVKDAKRIIKKKASWNSFME